MSTEAALLAKSLNSSSTFSECMKARSFPACCSIDQSSFCSSLLAPPEYFPTRGGLPYISLKEAQLFRAKE